MINVIVTVLIPVFNCEEYILDSLRSILNQTIQDIEVLIIYDDSTDKTHEIIKKLEMMDSRIKIIYGEGDGLSSAMNKGLEYANGEYIARMDADDVSMENRLEKQLQMMKAKNLDICGCHWKVIDANGETLDHMLMPTKNETISIRLACTVPFAHGSVMIRNSFIKTKKIKYENGIVAEDYNMWIQMYQKGAKFGNVDEILFEYRELPQSLSKKNLVKNIKNTIKLSKEFYVNNKNQLTNDIEKILKKEIIITKQDQVYLMLLILYFFKKNYLLRSLRILKKKYIIIGTMMWIERLRYEFLQ